MFTLDEEGIKKDQVYLVPCGPVAEVIYINVDLLRYGHSPFQTDCNGDPHGNTADKKKKYLRKRITTSETLNKSARTVKCGGGEGSDLWTLRKPTATLDVEVDPFTSLLQKKQDVEYLNDIPISSMSTTSCTEDTIERRTVNPGGTYQDCSGFDQNKFITMEFQDENDDEKLSTNASSLLNHFTALDTSEIPQYNAFVDIIPGTNGTQSRSGASVSNLDESLPWRAKHFVSEDRINKSRIIAKFLVDAPYTLAEGSYDDDGEVSVDYNPLINGTVQMATAGQIITVDPPSEKNKFIELHACREVTGCGRPNCSSSVKGTTANEVKKTLPPAPDCSQCDDIDDCGPFASDCPCNCIYPDFAKFVGTDGELYAKKTETNTSEISPNISATINFDSGELLFLGCCSNSDGSNSFANDDGQRVTVNGTITRTGTDKTHSVTIDETCKNPTGSSFNPDPDPVSETSSSEIGGDVTQVEIETERGELEDGSCAGPSDPADKQCPNVTNVTTTPETLSFADAGGSIEYIGGHRALPNVTSDLLCSGSEDRNFRLTYNGPGASNVTGPVETGTSSRTITAHRNSLEISDSLNVSLTQDLLDSQTPGVTMQGDNIDIGTKITTSSTITGTQLLKIVLSDPVKAESNYTETIIPNTSVPEDDPNYDDGVRDGTLVESITYTGNSRSEVNLTEVIFEVQTVPSPALDKALEHFTYINYLISEIDYTDPNEAVLKHETFTELIDTRCNNPERDNPGWTVEKKKAISINLPDVSGNTATVSKINCFSKVRFGSESSCT